MKRLLCVICGCTLISGSLSLHAALVSKLSGQVVYDTDYGINGITWLADFNFAKTSGFDSDGRMSWSVAQTWIGSLNSANYLGFNDWRLPETVFPDSGCTLDGSGNSANAGDNCSQGELGHLFYDELGGTADNSILNSGDPDLDLFSNLVSNRYWSGTELLTNTTRAWRFNFNDGDLSANSKSSILQVTAVRTGDVSLVPVPAAAWLFGSGLLGLLGIARKRKPSF